MTNCSVFCISHISFRFFCRCPTVITLSDVRKALMSREEFDIFTNEGLGSGLQLSSTELSNL